MILVDTSVWVGHLRDGDAELAAQLDAGAVLMHPLVLGELALGNLHERRLILESLADLAQAVVADAAEVLAFIDRAGLYGRGVGYVDAHLLASVRLTPGASLWTRDRRLRDVADALGFEPGR